MVILIGGASHTGKTSVSQKLLEKLHYPYVSIDHLKMGLIRSGQTPLTPEDDAQLEEYLWPIVREMVKTAVENRQNLIVEGAYIPANWRQSFSDEYLPHIRCVFLIMTGEYIDTHFADIRRYANVVEARLDDSSLTAQWLKEENEDYFRQCVTHGCDYILIDKEYSVTAEAVEAFL